MKWTQALLDDAREAFAREGSWVGVASRYGVSSTAVRVAVKRNRPSGASGLGGSPAPPSRPAPAAGPLSPISSNVVAFPTRQNVAQCSAPGSFSPISTHGCRVRRPEGAQPGWAWVLPDMHVPFHDQRALDLVSWVIEDVANIYCKDDPELILLGDYLDCLEVSKHRKDPDIRVKFADELVAGRAVRGRLESLRRWRRCSVTLGNHENRLRNYITDSAPALEGIVPTIGDLLEMPKHGWNVVPYGEVYRFRAAQNRHRRPRHRRLVRRDAPGLRHARLPLRRPARRDHGPRDERRHRFSHDGGRRERGALPRVAQ